MSSTPAARRPPMKAQKTERSHEENQERAYIAASRRADRSLEARVQSARMASEIHRRRTGRGLKVTEEIVLKEEMYEEEDDDLPRQYRYLTAHLQTGSSDMNSRVNAYITTQAAMATMARYNEINKLFNESFPSAQSMQQRYDQSVYAAPIMRTGSVSAAPAQGQTSPLPMSPTTKKRSYSEHSQPAETPQTLLTSPATASISSPPALTPNSAGSEFADAKSPVQQGSFIRPPRLDTQLVAQPAVPSSVFTSELPNEIKMMGNFDLADPMAMQFFGGTSDAWLNMFGQQADDTFKFGSSATAGHVNGELTAFSPAELDHPLEDDAPIFSPVDGHFAQRDFGLDSLSRLGTPAGGDNWESFVDFGSER
ncbi:uncharacterized protein B0I36DRAFT_363763 [Microdochium trichocladiopsis]|uniref:Uncharacterized protein n=1 Tax=Microdochium trichocladiopsis TaxID=1682393 RepID=A0A9P8Y6A3_9PEZI|nr:uncharacterized protein B0I36DRAFT_363763 [Microdochium trichocladiopsis]KAH7029188.1 hypothetical protein B0I36DRAFT_363763 [Microdochium trichocladiopsis]